MKQNIHAFDFDGTLTTCDTLLAFIRYACGTRAFVCGFMKYAPLLMLMKLHLYPNDRAKEHVFKHFFGGMTTEKFNCLCRNFARDNRHLLRSESIAAMNTALNRGCKVVVVSASIENWVVPFFTDISHTDTSATGNTTLHDLSTPVTVIGTKIETRDNRITGRFLTPNCYGQEKVRRLTELFPDRTSYHLTAYGDSRGDRELLAFADKGVWIK